MWIPTWGLFFLHVMLTYVIPKVVLMENNVLQHVLQGQSEQDFNYVVAQFQLVSTYCVTHLVDHFQVIS